LNEPERLVGVPKRIGATPYQSAVRPDDLGLYDRLPLGTIDAAKHRDTLAVANGFAHQRVAQRRASATAWATAALS